MTDIPNCSNCSNETCPNNHMHDNAYKDWGAEQSRKEIQSHTLKRGCLKNPQAQGYLMKDVIEELEKTIKCNSRWEKLEPYYQGVNEMCKRAIDLIRNGVK